MRIETCNLTTESNEREIHVEEEEGTHYEPNMGCNLR